MITQNVKKLDKTRLINKQTRTTTPVNNIVKKYTRSGIYIVNILCNTITEEDHENKQIEFLLLYYLIVWIYINDWI